MKTKTPWPTKAAMSQIYEKNLWGGAEGTFYSGEGSHDVNFTKPYVIALAEFLSTLKKAPIILDLGCGDFNVGRQLVQFASEYIAVDIVSELIDFNKKTFKLPNLEFKCLDIATQNLPKADCVILRQVLQHLSNREVKEIVDKLINYQYIILTEHIPSGAFKPNVDIISGQGIRLKKNSGINLLAPPFNLKVKSEQELINIPHKETQGSIATMIYEMYT